MIERDYKPVILRYHILSTKIWVESIGAGGGSIAWVDAEAGLAQSRTPRRGRSAGSGLLRLSAASNRRFPTPISSSAISTKIIFSAAGCSLDKQAQRWRDRAKDRRSRWELTGVEAASGIYRIANVAHERSDSQGDA